MNQYYQWPQQQPEMGLAQPGLEEMAQQYAAGGLVAFANGGLASMLPMGYAGEDDVPVFNYDGGEDYEGMRGFANGEIVRRALPFTTFDEDEYNAGEGENFGDVGTGTYGISPRDLARSARENEILQEREDAKRNIAAREANREFVTEDISDFLTRPIGGARVKDPVAAARNEYESVRGPISEQIPTTSGAPSFLDKSKGVLAAVGEMLTPDKTVKPDAGAAKQPSAPKASEGRSIPAPTPVPKEVPKSDERPGVSLLSPAAWTGGPLQSSYNDPSNTIIVDDQGEEGQRVNLDPNNNAGVARIVNSGLSADQQIAAIAKYMQTDTSEAMRIKGEMEKQSARAGNLGIIASLANAVGLGLGTYGPAQNRWGAGLAGLASGLIGAEQANESRQAKLNELALKVKEMEGSGTRKAAEMVLNQRAKAAAEADEFKKQLALKKLEGEYGVRKSQESAGARRYAADVGAEAKRTGGGMNEYQMVQARGEAQKAADVAWERELGSKPRTPETLARWREIYNQKLQELINGFVPAGGSAAPTGRSRGFFDGTQLR
jgi:hypothetical protein